MINYYQLYDYAHKSENAEEHSQTLAQLLEHTTTHFNLNKRFQNLLEIGCGQGNNVQAFLENCSRYHGIDISENALDHALKNKTDESDFSLHDICGATFQNDFILKSQFDCIVDGHCLHCITDPEHRKVYLSQVYKLLSEDGYFICETMIATKQMSFDYPLIYDENEGVLWKEISEDLSHFVNPDQIYSRYGTHFMPYRALHTPLQIEEEILSAGLKIDYFFCDQYAEFVIPEMRNSQVLRFICHKDF